MEQLGLDDVDQIMRLLDEGKHVEVAAIPQPDRYTVESRLGVTATRKMVYASIPKLLGLAVDFIRRSFSKKQLDDIKAITDKAMDMGYNVEITTKADGSRRIVLKKAT